MSEHRILKRIGAKLRDESRDIVNARLPERLRQLIEHLAVVEVHDGQGDGRRRHAVVEHP